eukprot:4972073-Ditylum_brightwellii.AAC.1
MDVIQQHFLVRDMMDSPEYYLGNDLIGRGNKIHVLTKNYVMEVLCKYKEKHGALAKENLPLKSKIHQELENSPNWKKKDTRNSNTSLECVNG